MSYYARIDEFKTEAGTALFNKQQAVSIIKHLLQLEAADTTNHSAAECNQFALAAEKVNFSYIDNTSTQTDALLDAYGVARITVEDITNAIEHVMFDVK